MGFQIEQGASDDILHVSAVGKITAEDYEKLLLPILEKIRSEGKKLRLLLIFGQDFDGYTAGAAWEDAKLGLRYMRVIERCAVVSDIKWIKNLTHFFGSLIPCTVTTYGSNGLSEAKEWLNSGDIAMEHELDERCGVLNIEVRAPVSSLLMEVLTHTVDEYLERKGELKGLVIHAKRFPGWEDLGSMISHISFVKNHHKKIKRVALVIDGSLAKIAENLAKQFVKAEVKHFDYKELDDANEWVRD